MKKSRNVQKTVEETEDIICNKCGSSCKVFLSASDDPVYGFEGLLEVEVSGGYGASILNDGDVHQFSLCEKCLVELISTFKHPSFQGNRTDYPVWEDEKPFVLINRKN